MKTNKRQKITNLARILSARFYKWLDKKNVGSKSGIRSI